MAKAVKIVNLSSEVQHALDQYVDDIADGTDEAADKAAKQCLKEIKEGAKTFKNHNKKKPYNKMWKKKQTTKARGKSGYTIYCDPPGLPHLLEHGHAKVNGGRVEGKPHIAPAAEKAVQDFQSAVKGVIEHATGGV